jgi:hypothetical protein
MSTKQWRSWSGGSGAAGYKRWQNGLQNEYVNLKNDFLRATDFILLRQIEGNSRNCYFLNS